MKNIYFLIILILMNINDINIQFDTFGNLYLCKDNTVYYVNFDEEKISFDKYFKDDIKINYKNYKIIKIEDSINYDSLKEQVFENKEYNFTDNDEDDYVIFKTAVNFNIYKRETELPFYVVNIYKNNLLIFSTKLIGINPIYKLNIFDDGNIILNYNQEKYDYNLNKLL